MGWFRPVRGPPVRGADSQERLRRARMTTADWWKLAIGRVPRTRPGTVPHALSQLFQERQQQAYNTRLERWVKHREAWLERRFQGRLGTPQRGWESPYDQTRPQAYVPRLRRLRR